MLNISSGRMLSCGDNAAIKVAVETCNNPELKREILLAPESEYNTHISEESSQYDRKHLWDEVVKQKAKVILKNIGLPKRLQERVMVNILSVAMGMLTWAQYHERNIGFSREYSINFLRSSFFTQEGMIDNKKAAAKLMNDENLSHSQKYKLACFYCFTDRVFDLYRRMTIEDRNKFYNADGPHMINQPGLVKVWSYCLMNNIDILVGDKNLYLYKLEKAIENGSKAAVDYCLQKMDLNQQDGAVVSAAVETVKNRIRVNNSIVFEDWRYDDSEVSWVPGDYYVDILFFLLSKMRDDQQIEFLKIDIEGVQYSRESFEDVRRSRVLEYFLNWPYQNYFMKIAGLMWEFLPERNYAILLLKICDKIDSNKNNNLKYGAEKSYDYRNLLREFWIQSPERYKRYVFSNSGVCYRSNHRNNQEVTHRSSRNNQDVVRMRTCEDLLKKLFTLKNFTLEDRENIKLILASATDVEKVYISSEETVNVCIALMKEEKCGIFDEFPLDFFPSKKEAEKFKMCFGLSKEAQLVCCNLLRGDNWNAVESFIKWCALSEDGAKEKINKLKRELIYSRNGNQVCLSMVEGVNGVETANKFLKWCIPSEEEIKVFKKELIFSQDGIQKCTELVTSDQLELVNEMVNFCLSSEEEVEKLKKNVAHEAGIFVFQKFIYNYRSTSYYDMIDRGIKFEGDQLETLEKFLTWCFSSEEKISDFKKEFLKISGVEIHYNLVRTNQWAEAQQFFAWLNMSAAEIKDLKKYTLFHYVPAGKMFVDQIQNTELLESKNKYEAVELLLRWYLTDEETVYEFRDKFKNEFQEITEEVQAVFKIFDLMINKRLSDLQEETRGGRNFFHYIRRSPYLSASRHLRPPSLYQLRRF